MASIWRKTGDNLKNGAILGALFGAAIVWGAPIYSFLLINIPAAWLQIGSYSMQIYLIVFGAMIGYWVDRK